MNQLLHKLNQAIEESSDDLKQALKPVDPAELKAAETSMFEIIRLLKSGPNQSKFDTLELYYLADGILWDFKFRGDSKKYRVIMKELKDAKTDPNMKRLAQDATPVEETGGYSVETVKADPGHGIESGFLVRKDGKVVKHFKSSKEAQDYLNKVRSK
jgi:hypothetical protein